jgi:hypothetical protein
MPIISNLPASGAAASHESNLNLFVECPQDGDDSAEEELVLDGVSGASTNYVSDRPSSWRCWDCDHGTFL